MSGAAKYALGIPDAADAPTEVQTQYICDPKFVTACPCAGDDGDLGEFTCACAAEPVDGLCPECTSPMVLIDTNTGEPVATEGKA